MGNLMNWKPPPKTVPPLSFPDSLLFLLRCLPSSFTTCKTLKSLDPKIWTLIKLFNVENSLISILSDVSLCADQMVYQVQEISQFLSGKRKKERKPNKASINATQPMLLRLLLHPSDKIRENQSSSTLLCWLQKPFWYVLLKLRQKMKIYSCMHESELSRCSQLHASQRADLSAP